MSKYILIDTANLFSRARHVVRGDIDTKVSMAMHIVFTSIQKCWNTKQADHLVFAFEGRSWRKDIYPPYKKNRADARSALSESDMEEEQLFWESIDNFKAFVQNKTNCTTLQHQELEADDLIAGWIQRHPNDDHLIISSDSDFVQLIAPNVSQYNGITETTTSINGYFDKDNKPIIDKKTKKPKEPPNPDYLLFEKIVRGDSSDNVFSAYPGVRRKGSKNKVGIIEAFNDRTDKGFEYNSFMLNKWIDHKNCEHRVLDDFNRNRTLIDLAAQPEDIKLKIFETIEHSINREPVDQVGARLIQFCNQHSLVKIAEMAQFFAHAFAAKYPAAKIVDTTK